MFLSGRGLPAPGTGELEEQRTRYEAGAKDADREGEHDYPPGKRRRVEGQGDRKH